MCAHCINHIFWVTKLHGPAAQATIGFQCNLGDSFTQLHWVTHKRGANLTLTDFLPVDGKR